MIYGQQQQLNTNILNTNNIKNNICSSPDDNEVFNFLNRGIKYPKGGYLENCKENNINNNNINICSSSVAERDSSISTLEEEKEEDTNAEDFEKIWAEYPRKSGKNTAYKHYLSWLKGKKYAGKTIKLDRVQIWKAVVNYQFYVKEKNIEPQYIKMGSTFFNEAIMEYLEDE